MSLPGVHMQLAGKCPTSSILRSRWGMLWLRSSAGAITASLSGSGWVVELYQEHFHALGHLLQCPRQPSVR